MEYTHQLEVRTITKHSDRLTHKISSFNIIINSRDSIIYSKVKIPKCSDDSCVILSASESEGDKIGGRKYYYTNLSDLANAGYDEIIFKPYIKD